MIDHKKDEKFAEKAQKKLDRLKVRIARTDDPQKLEKAAVKANDLIGEVHAKLLSHRLQEGIEQETVWAAAAKIPDQARLRTLWEDHKGVLRNAAAHYISDPAFLMGPAWEEGSLAVRKDILSRIDDVRFLKKVASDKTLSNNSTIVPAIERLQALEKITDQEIAKIALYWNLKEAFYIGVPVSRLIRDPEAAAAAQKEFQAEQDRLLPYRLWDSAKYGELLKQKKIPQDLCGKLCDRFIKPSENTFMVLRDVIGVMEQQNYPWEKHVKPGFIKALADEIQESTAGYADAMQSFRFRNAEAALKKIYRTREDLRPHLSKLNGRSWSRTHDDVSCSFGHTDHPARTYHMAVAPGEELDLSIVSEEK